jgi:5,10-methylenetetrahydrofolate reductase
MTESYLPSDIHFSLEVFPPKSQGGLDQLLNTVDAYSVLKPAYITVTFGPQRASCCCASYLCGA